MKTTRVLDLQTRTERAHTWLAEFGILRLRSIATLLAALTLIPAMAAEDTSHGPDSQRQAGVPRGTVTRHVWKSKVFEGTIREFFVYVPAQYDGGEPAAVMVFQDGHTFVKEGGDYRVPVVFDNLFRKVVSHIGSFTNIRGGYHYPALIRKGEKKPLRVFLQDGSGDLDNAHGNWWLSNQQMEAALKFAKWDYKTVWGEGGHNGKHGGAIFPDTLRWIWRD